MTLTNVSLSSTTRFLGPVSPKSRNFFGRWRNSLRIFKTKVFRVKKLCSYFHFYPLYNMWKDQLHTISGSELYEWLFGLVKFSGLLRNARLESEVMIFESQLIFCVGAKGAQNALWEFIEWMPRLLYRNIVPRTATNKKTLMYMVEAWFSLSPFSPPFPSSPSSSSSANSITGSNVMVRLNLGPRNKSIWLLPFPDSFGNPAACDTKVPLSVSHCKGNSTNLVSYFNSLPKYLNYEICASWQESHFNYIARIRLYSRIFTRANVLLLLLIGWECGPRFFSRSCTVNKTKEMNFTWLATPTSSLPKRKILGHLFLPRCLKQRSRCFLSPSLLFLSFSVSCLPASPFLFRTLIPISRNSPLMFSLHIERFVLPSQKVKFSTWNKSETL